MVRLEVIRLYSTIITSDRDPKIRLTSFESEWLKVAPMMIKGAMNGESFLAYIEQCLAPTLKRRDIVLFHPLKTVLRKAAERTIKGCTDVFVPIFGRSILPNAWATLDMQAMNHYDRDALSD